MLSISRRIYNYLIFNWRQLSENTPDLSTSTFNSFRTVENQTMVLFWLLTGLKFHAFWYINHYVLKKKVFHLIRGCTSDVMKPLQFFPSLILNIPNFIFFLIHCINLIKTQKSVPGIWSRILGFRPYYKKPRFSIVVQLIIFLKYNRWKWNTNKLRTFEAGGSWNIKNTELQVIV